MKRLVYIAICLFFTGLVSVTSAYAQYDPYGHEDYYPMDNDSDYGSYQPYPQEYQGSEQYYPIEGEGTYEGEEYYPADNDGDNAMNYPLMFD